MSLSVSVTTVTREVSSPTCPWSGHLLEVVDEHDRRLAGLVRARRRRPAATSSGWSSLVGLVDVQARRRTRCTAWRGRRGRRGGGRARRRGHAGRGPRPRRPLGRRGRRPPRQGAAPPATAVVAASSAMRRWTRRLRVVLEGEDDGVPARQRRRCAPSAAPSSSCRCPRCRRGGRARRSAVRRRGWSRAGRTRWATPAPRAARRAGAPRRSASSSGCTDRRSRPVGALPDACGLCSHRPVLVLMEARVPPSRRGRRAHGFATIRAPRVASTRADGHSAMPTYLVSRYSSMPSKPPSRPKPGLLDAPEGCGRVRDDAGVDADHPELHRLGDPEHPGLVVGVDVADEAVLGAVGLGDGIRVVGEGGDRRDRAEDLLAQAAAVGRHVGQDGRLVEPAAARAPGPPPVSTVAPLPTAS